MEKRKLFLSKRIIALYVKAEKEKKNMDMQQRGTELQMKRLKKIYKDGNGIK